MKSRNFLMTKYIYAKAKSHYNLWKYLLDENKNKNNYNWFLILEDDVVLPDKFDIYLKQLAQFLNKIPSNDLDKVDILSLSSYGNYTKQYTTVNNIILTFMLNILVCVFTKKTRNNKSQYKTQIDEKEWNLINSNFPLGTHAYLVNLKQLEKLKNHFDETKIYYHLDIQLNLDNFNISSITPFGIRRGGFKDATTPTLTTPSLPVKMMTMFNPELAHDLGKPIINILGIYQINILIILYGIFLIIWQIIDLPGRLQDFFESI